MTTSTNFADSLKPSIYVFGWSIFCYGNLILYQKKKEMKMIKTQILWSKTTKNTKKVYIRIKLHFL